VPVVMVVFDGGFLDRPIHSLHFGHLSTDA
jgi:hypothetical protein